MLYMVETTFLYGASFDVVYNDSAHENMKTKNRKTFFQQSSEKNINLNKDGCGKQLCVIIHPYIYQLGAI